MAVIARSGQRAGAVVVRAFPWRFLVVPLAMSALALGSAAAAELAYSSRALPGLTVAGVAVGSLEAPALRERLESEIAAPWAAAGVTLRDGDREWTTTNGALGIVPDVDAAVAAALAYGKSGSALDRAGVAMPSPGSWPPSPAMRIKRRCPVSSRSQAATYGSPRRSWGVRSTAA